MPQDDDMISDCSTQIHNNRNYVTRAQRVQRCFQHRHVPLRAQRAGKLIGVCGGDRAAEFVGIRRGRGTATRTTTDFHMEYLYIHVLEWAEARGQRSSLVCTGARSMEIYFQEVIRGVQQRISSGDFMKRVHQGAVDREEAREEKEQDKEKEKESRSGRI